MVKRKLFANNNTYLKATSPAVTLASGAALLTFIVSLWGAFPPRVVELWYSRAIFPTISYLLGRFADAVPFSWLDVATVTGVAVGIAMLYRRYIQGLIALIAATYLVFFWLWGLNYHRLSLAEKVGVEPLGHATGPAIEQLAMRTAGELNRLYLETRRTPLDSVSIQAEVADRVQRVVEVIDGSKWVAATRVKSSWLLNPWFRIAGVDGLFNPFGHEPIINDGLLDLERPFVTAHELAHVRGYSEEGDANFIALLAAVLSKNPNLQYSGWLHLWPYLRRAELDKLLDDGPRADLNRIDERIRTDQIRWLSHIQSAVLDWYLKANSVEEGVRSYSRLVLLAVGTEKSWERFR